MFKIRVEFLEIHETETIQPSGFEKRMAIVKTVEQYPQTLKMEFTQNNVNLLDQVLPGQIRTITFNIRGNVGTKKTQDGKDMYFQSLNAWKIEL